MNQRRTVELVIEEGGPVVQRGDAHWLRRGRSANSRVGGSGARKRREKGGPGIFRAGRTWRRAVQEREREKRELGERVEKLRGTAHFYTHREFSDWQKADHARLGGRWLRSGVFFPLARDQERRRPPGYPANCHTLLRHRKTGSRPGPSKLYFPHEIVGSRRGSLLTDVCIAVAFDGFAACQLSTSRS
jgi:hypothetical protein